MQADDVAVSGKIEFGFDGKGRASLFNTVINVHGNINFGFNVKGTLIELPTDVNVRGSINFGFQVQGSVVFDDPAASDSLLLDICIYEPQPAGITFYKARLRKNNIEMPITDFSFNEASGIGITLDVSLAKADLNLISKDDELIFELGLKSGGAGDYEWYKLAEGLNRAGRSRSIGFQNNLPNDKVSMTFRDALAEKIEAAPIEAEFYYDVFKVDKKPDVKSNLVNELGRRINTKVIGVANLSLNSLLNRAYVQGCKFDKVISSLDNIPVQQAAFTPDGGYHSTIANLISKFSPIYKVENNTLILFDAGGRVPVNTSIIEVPFDNNIRVLSDRSAGSRKIHQLIVTSNIVINDLLLYREFNKYDKPTTSGEFGMPDFTEKKTSFIIREYYYASDQETVVKTANYQTIQETRLDGNLIARDVTTEKYDGFGNKKSHLRIVEALMPTLPNGEKILQTVLEEKLSITYRINPFNPNEIVQDSLVASQEGLILINHDIAPFDSPYEMTFLDANSAGYIDPNADQTTEWKKIRTIFKDLQIISPGQINLVGQTINHLTGALEDSFNETAPGISIIPRKRSIQKEQVIGIVPVGQTATRPEKFDGGDLPEYIVSRLAKRQLAELKQNPFDISLDLTYFSPILEYGAYIRPHDRSGAMSTFLIKERRISGQNLGSEGQLISTNLTAREVIENE